MSLPAHTVRFGPFELDLRAAELHHEGTKTKLPEQPFQILTELVGHPGEVVTREELRQRLWRSDTFVDFEHGLNTAVKRLREALGDSAENPRYIETLPRHGYRLIVPVEKAEPAASITSKGPVRRRSLWLAVSVLIIAAVAAGVVWRLRLRERFPPVKIESLAVLPLENLSGNPEEEYFADGMTEALITELGKLHTLRVISRQSVMQYKGTSKTVPQIAGELKVDAVVEGSALRADGKVRITTQLIQANPERHLWSESYERDLKDVIALQGEVTQAIAREIRVSLTAKEQARLAAVTPVNPQAYDAYLTGRFHFYKGTPQGLEAALEYFQRALDKDPNYAPAYVGIGYVWALRAHTGLTSGGEGWAKAKSAALRALELDNMLAEAHDILGTVLVWHEWDWAAGEREYRRAIDLDPNYANVRSFYSLFLTAMRRPQEAKQQIERALELDPYNPLFHITLAEALLDEHRPDEALLCLQRAATLQPDNMFIHVYLSEAYDEKGEYEHARAEWREFFRLRGVQDAVEAMDRGYAEGGYRRAMRATADALSARSHRAVINLVGIARLYAAAGEKDRALDWLEKAYEEHSSMLPYVNVWREWEPLRSDPRFQDLLRRMNFPP
jgi:TolB-like protein/DNA-binding winged helix-turn-helix (wHTH) protein/Tfp pilus assembly protein PilF